MSTASVAAIGALAAGLIIGVAGAQRNTSQSAPVPRTTSLTLGERCSINDKTEAAETALLKTYTSPALEVGLRPGGALWALITSPSTPYIDRMAAATRGGAVLSPRELPLLWQAMAEIESVPTGVAPAPCTSVPLEFMPPTLDTLQHGLNKQSERTFREVLGRKIQLPKKTVEYPITAEERNHSPWLWQMKRALSTLFTNVNIYYGDLSRYPLRVKAAWDWPITVPPYRAGEVLQGLDRVEWAKIRIRSRALCEDAPHDALFLKTIIKLATNENNAYVASSAYIDDLRPLGKDGYHYEELIHAAQIVILQRTIWQSAADRAAWEAAQLARTKPSPPYAPYIRPLKTATAILAIGRWAMDKSLSPWNRYYGFVNPICAMVDDPPISPNQFRNPDDPRVGVALKAFEAWFAKRKATLERQAAAERPHLQSLAQDLSNSIE